MLPERDEKSWISGGKHNFGRKIIDIFVVNFAGILSNGLKIFIFSPLYYLTIIYFRIKF